MFAPSPSVTATTEEKQQALQALLASRTFHRSEQLKRILVYLCAKELEGRSEEITEYLIGVEALGRSEDFSPVDDSSVRSRVHALRKKLQEYYLVEAPEVELRVELPTRSYSLQFLRVAAASRPAQAPDNSRMTPEAEADRWSRLAWRLFAAVAVVAVAATLSVIGLFGYNRSYQSESALQSFWAPLLRSKQPVLISVATPITYRFDDSVARRFGRLAVPGHLAHFPPIDFRPDGIVRGREIHAATEARVGVGDCYAVANLAGFLARFAKPFEVKIDARTRLEDLRRSPVVVIGAYSNEWNARLTSNLRFGFDTEPTFLIREHGGAGRQWTPRNGASPDEAEDYILITRTLDQTTGQPLLAVAGTVDYGTEAGGEALTNPGFMTEMVSRLPADWRQRSLQVVLHTRVINRTPGTPNVVAQYVW
jgi:hypothetical protein